MWRSLGGRAPANKDIAPDGVEIHGRVESGYDRILTTDALAFVAMLHRRFEPRRRELLDRRGEVQRGIDQGEMPDFLG